MRVNWIGQLTGMTCNEKFNQFSDIVNTTMNDIAPVKTVKISAKRRYVEPWMTKGLETAFRTKLKLYKIHLKKGSTENDLNNYRKYHNTYNALLQCQMCCPQNKFKEALDPN